MLLPTATPGILTGIMLAIARAAGETAPLLFTALFSEFWISRTFPAILPKTLGDLMKPTPSLAVLIYNFSAYRGDVSQKVEQALRSAALWDEVKDKLHTSGLAPSGGQQQRQCLARAIATEPSVFC